MTCPCGKGETFDTCCAPYLRGEKLPDTAEELMRSRYSAYVLGKVDYILDTHDPERIQEVDRKNTELWSKSAKWLGFEVLHTEKGLPGDEEGVVEFAARYTVQGTTINHRERSLFRKLGHRWVFVDGQPLNGPPARRPPSRVGRNEPCPCGSGKKSKRCCGQDA